MSYPEDYIKERAAAGCPRCGGEVVVEKNPMGDAELVCVCGWRSHPIDCGLGGHMADAYYERDRAAAEAEKGPRRADELRTMALFYSGLRRAVY